MQYLLTYRSLTWAQRGARALERAGVTGTVTRVPRQAARRGCGYGLIVTPKNRDRAVDVLRAAGLSPERMFVREDDGTIREGAE